MGFLGKTVLAISSQPLVERTFTTWRAGRRLAMRFVAGETLEDAMRVAGRLNQKGMTVSLDHLGEHVTDRDMARAAREDYLACLDRIAFEGLNANISVKLTQLGLGLDDELAEESVGVLAQRAAEQGATVTIDMEESRYTEATVQIFARQQQLHGNLGVALQAYLRRTVDDLAKLSPLGGHIRLCKGAYAEPPEIAYQSKAEVNESFDRLLRDLIAAETTKPAIATHDHHRIGVATRLLGERSGPFEFQMLYGVRKPLQERLVTEGYPVRIYVPYGAEWYPYLSRRIAERPANLVFFLRAVLGR